eukprot:scaffold108398_cov13-Tisochrysis_lutea.AAC.1
MECLQKLIFLRSHKGIRIWSFSAWKWQLVTTAKGWGGSRVGQLGACGEAGQTLLQSKDDGPHSDSFQSGRGRVQRQVKRLRHKGACCSSCTKPGGQG